MVRIPWGLPDEFPGRRQVLPSLPVVQADFCEPGILLPYPVPFLPAGEEPDIHCALVHPGFHGGAWLPV